MNEKMKKCQVSENGRLKVEKIRLSCDDLEMTRTNEN